MGKKAKVRDNFALGTRRKLWERVGGRCSKPDCRVPTLAALVCEEGVSNIGRAAHITAAAEGGPRYDPLLTPQQRKGIRNAIWLCANHADLIDDDVSAFPETLLREWKSHAERMARQEQGAKLPTEEDGRKLVAAVLGATPALAPHAIRNAHQAVTETLEAMDERFKVTSAFSNGTTEIQLTPRIPIDLELRIDISRDPMVQSRLQSLLARGESLSVARDAITIMGSPLLQHIADSKPNGKLELHARARDVRVHLWLQKAESHERVFEEIFDAHMVSGSEQAGLEASLLDGLVRLKFTILPGGHGRLEVAYSVDSWHGQDVSKLSHYAQFRALIDGMAGGSTLNARFMQDGNCFAVARTQQRKAPDVEGWHAIFSYLDACRTIAKVASRPICYDKRTTLNGESLAKAHQMAMWVDGTFRATRASLAVNPTFVVTYPHAVDTFPLHKEEGMIQLPNVATPPIELFGQLIELPRHDVTMTHVRLRASARPADASGAQSWNVEVEMLEGFELAIAMHARKIDRADSAEAPN